MNDAATIRASGHASGRSRQAPRRPVRWLILASHVDETGSGGGIVRYSVELIRNLDKIDGIEIHVACTRKGAAFFRSDLGLSADRVHVLPTSNTIALSLLERFGAHPVFHRRWDVVQGVKHLVPKFTRTSLRVLTVYDTILLDRPQDFGWAKRNLLKRHYLGSIADSDHVICISQATADRLRERVPTAATKSAIVKLVGAGTLDHVAPEPVEELIGKRFALAVGDPSPRKNLRFVATLWPEVCARIPDATLAVVGPTGWGTAAGTEELGRLVATGTAIELGHISNEKLRWAYENAAMTLCPSLLEGFGLPVAEARRAGSAVISSSDPAQIEAAASVDGFEGAGSFVHISVSDPNAWVNAIVDHFTSNSHAYLRDSHHPRPPTSAPRIERTWANVAHETSAIVSPPARTDRFSVVQANKGYTPRIGGVETVIRDIAVGLARRGVHSTVITAGERDASGVSNDDGVRVRRSRTLWRARSVPFAPSMIRAFRAERGDALLIHEPSIITLLTYLLAGRTPHRRVVVWWHFEVTRQKVLWILVRRLMHRMLDQADAIITATPHHVSSSAVLPRYADKISYIPFGIDLPRWRRLATSPCPVRIDEPFVLFVGRLVYYKGIPELLQVVETLPNTRFVVVGSGPLESLLHDHEAYRSGRLELLGHLTDEQLASLMKHARVLAFSSATETEAFGIVQSQAMALGTPVVGFDLPTGTTWVNEHEVSGVVVPLGDCGAYADAVARILSDDGYHARLSCGAMKRANDEFDFDVYIDRVLDVLRGP